MESYDVVIVGGGISGMRAAYGLRQRGADVLVVEAGPEVGGTIRSAATPEGYVLDFGPNTVTSRDPELWEEFAALGLDQGMLEAERRGGRRFVLFGGRPELVPTSPRQLLRTPLLSTTDKLRLLAEPFMPRAGAPDESVAAFFGRRIGAGPTRRLVDPFVSGVYGGDATTISVRSAFPALWAAERRAGSLLLGLLTAPRPRRPRGAPRPRSVLFNFPEGLAAWPRAYAAAIGPERVWTRSVARSLQRVDGDWHLMVDREGGRHLVEAEQVVIATPAGAAADLLGAVDGEAADALRAIPHAPLAVVHLGYARGQVSHPLDGFGLLCPAVEQRRVLGILWPSSLFRGRAPEGAVLTASFVGGARSPELARLPDAEIVALARAENEAILGAYGPPKLSRVTRWSPGIPQYVAGHDRLIAAVARMEERNRGLYVVGNYRGGVSVEKGWRAGAVVAERIAEHRARARVGRR